MRLTMAEMPVLIKNFATRQGFQVAWLVENRPPEDPPIEPKWTIHDLSQILEIVEETDS